MALRFSSFAQIFVVGFIAGIAFIPMETVADNSHLHSGQVVERGKGTPVITDVKAWKAVRQTGKPGECPEFGDTPVDSKISDSSSGEFDLKVPTKLATYHVVYCANGYHRRVDRHLPNDEDNSPVIPKPARLRKQSDSAVVNVDAVRLALYALNELSYLYDLSPEAFTTSLNEYSSRVSKQDRNAAKVLGMLSELIAQWASP